MRKLSKKLLLSILSVALVFIALGTTTFAWFSMNNTVTIDGMQVHTQVSDNLFVAESTFDKAATEAETAFSRALHKTVSGLLEPVSTVDGMNFFYTSSSNAAPNGDAIEEEYIAYAAGDDFDANYGVNDALGYVDYEFQLKAINADTANAKYINLTTLNLAYRGSDPLKGLNAFRVAIFYDKLDGSKAFRTTLATYNQSAVLMQNASGANQTNGKAVKSTTALDDVTYGGFDPITVAAGATEYYKFVVRLWIEGEDKKCNNETFANLTDNFELDLQFDLVDNAHKLTKANITNGIYLLLKTTATGSSTSVNNTTLYPVTGWTYNGAQLYADNASLATEGVKLYIAAGTGAADTSVNPTEVTANFNLK